MWVDELGFVRLLFQLTPCLNILVVTPFGSYFLVPITVLGSVCFAFLFDLLDPQYFLLMH
jgi:hypothetical protein